MNYDKVEMLQEDKAELKSHLNKIKEKLEEIIKGIDWMVENG